MQKDLLVYAAARTVKYVAHGNEDRKMIEREPKPIYIYHKYPWTLQNTIEAKFKI